MKKSNQRYYLLLLVVLLLSGTLNVFASDARVDWLVNEGIISGRKVGNTVDLALNESIQRAEMTKLLVQYKGEASRAERTGADKGPFSDVAVGYWANGYINVAWNNKMISGFPDGTFKPQNPVTYAEMAALLVRHDRRWSPAMDKNAVWPYTYLTTAAEYGILKDVPFPDSNSPATRKAAFHMLYNAIHNQDYKVDITFDLQDPDLDKTTVMQVAKGQPLGPRFPVLPMRDGFTFIGWNNAADGSGEWINSSTPFSISTKLFGIWEQNGIAIRYVEEYPTVIVAKTEWVMPEDLSLPTYITLYFSNNTIQKVPITWDRATVNPTVAGQYTVYGTYEVPGKVTSGPTPVAKLQILVK
ncbi:MAG: hypothetical protein GXZ11_09125 [Tissierellia bacterium]|nr:hypothetical protein [Tissierellia bacterium]